MKLLIASAALACFLCVAAGNSAAVRQGAQAMKDEFKLSTDSKKDKAKSLPVTFSHVNHATKNYSVDGAHTIACVECHHTDQPAAEAAKHPPLKTANPADRTVTLTAETVKDAKTPEVATCRSCHAQDGD
ncbi:MAG TPA: cytochrome c3 family protein, partial [Pyrinomonadaceae bacterium]|nr:cytochrome c3 family protein [Pyrinomonadaceae bacterium]